MARKFLYLVALVVVAILAVLLALRIWPGALTRLAFEPSAQFESQTALAQNSYADAAMWISRPDKGDDDPARWTPAGMKDEHLWAKGQEPRTAVFFIHPTSYLNKSHWNGRIDDADSQDRAALFVRAMASPFNASGNVWAPRYRQATFGAFLSDKPEANQALALAYGDVAQAFDQFLASIGPDQPIVLVGHSQGAFHLMRLLRDRVSGTPLKTRIVAAYVIGWPVSITHDLPAMGLDPCLKPDQSGCVMSWQSYAQPADHDLTLEAYARFRGLDGKPLAGSPFLCTDPLMNSRDATGGANDNLGTLVPDKDLRSGRLVSHLVPASCGDDGFLNIGDPPNLGPYVLPGNNYHIYDIPLFWANVRADVAHRTAAWGVHDMIDRLAMPPSQPR